MPESAYQRKRLATLAAQAALMGLELTRQPDGTFTVTRWRLSRELPDLEAVAAFLAEMEGGL